jgi:hypothetical protein
MESTGHPPQHEEHMPPPVDPEVEGQQGESIALGEVNDGQIAIEGLTAAAVPEIQVIPEPEARWRSEADPGQKVELFLEENAPLFKDSADAWLQIKENQAQLREMNTGTMAKQSRAQRRAMDKQYGGLMKSPGAFMGLPKSRGQQQYTHIQRHGFTPEMTYAERKEGISVLFNKLRDEVKTQLEEFGVTDGFMLDFELNLVSASEVYAHAFLARDEALKHVNELLTDTPTAKAFIDRLDAMTEDPDDAQAKRPGFLELIATHVLQDGDTNMIRKAVQKTVPPPESYAKVFLDGQVAGNAENKGREINAIVGVIRLLSSIAEQDHNVDPEAIRQRMSERVEEWPVDLQNGLKNYATARNHILWEQMHQGLKPFEREGRLPIVTAGLQLGGAVIKGRHGQSLKQPTISLGARGQDHENIVEPEAIASFAVVGSKRGRSEKYDVEKVDSIEELYELSNLADYARQHSEDDTLEPLFKKALEHLTEKPFDKSCVGKLREVEYMLEGDPRDGTRHPLRFKPQSFPKVKKGPIAMTTRIIFDVVRIEGVSTLVVYGAFIKHDLEGMNKLPSRK